MEKAVAEELKVGDSMMDDVRRELDVLHQMSSSLLVFDMKRKRLESHFNSLVDLIHRKETEAMEAIRVKEEEARVERLEEQEKRFESIIKVKMVELEEEKKRVESKATEMEREVNEAKMDTDRMAVELCKKEREMRQAKIDAERMAMELCEKKKEVNQMKNVVDDLTVRIREDTRIGVTCKRLSGENFALQEEVKSLKKELEKREIWFNDVLKAEMKEVAEERERVERRGAEKEKEMRDAKMDKERMVVELCEKEKEVNEMKKTVADLSARIQEDARLDVVSRALSDENLALREEVKSLTQQLELKSHPLGREEQLATIQSFLQSLVSAGIITICDTIHPDLSGDDLFKLVREHIDDHEVASSKVSSALRSAKDKAQDLVTEALRFSYIAELEDQANESICRACRILLLEQLCHIYPQVASHAREEAHKVAVEWIAKLDDCVDKFSEISRFLRFISSYDVASEFEDEVLVPILYNAAIHEKTPDLCFTLGFEDKIAGFIKTLLKGSQRLKALEYVSAFKLEIRYSVGKIVQAEMNHINQTCHNMLKEGGQGHAPEIMNFEIDCLREVIKRIKDLKCEGKYTTVNLEERLVKLEKKKYFFKKRSADNPSPSSEHEPSKKKHKLPETSNLRESEPTDAVNVHPRIGSGDICCSKRSTSSDSESLTMKGHHLLGTAKSGEVSSKDTLNVLPESGSRDLCCSNPTSKPIQLSKEECELATISQSIESASNPESGYKALCCSISTIDPKPSRKEECQLPEISQPIESASNDILNAHPEGESRALSCSNSSTDPKTSTKAECRLPVTTRSIKSASNDTPNVNTESGSRSLCHSNPNRIPKRQKPRKKKGSKLPGTAKPTKVVPKDTSKVHPRSGSVTSWRLRNKPKPSNKFDCKFPRTAESGSSQKQASNTFPDIGSRNAHQSQEIEKAPTHFHPRQFHYGVVSPYICPSPQPSWYEPQDFPPPQYYQPYPPPSWYEPQDFPPPQYYQPYPSFEGYPEVPTLHYGMSDKPTYSDNWP